MSLADAKIVLTDLFQKQVADSIIDVHTRIDSINTSIITLQRAEINLLNQKAINDGLIVKNLNSVITNKDEEIVLLNDIIKQQKREIFKQKVLKVVSTSMAIIVPVIIVILTH